MEIVNIHIDIDKITTFVYWNPAICPLLGILYGSALLIVLSEKNVVYHLDSGVKTSWVQILSAAAAKSLQSCPTLCDPIDGSPPGSPVPGILQARTLEWGAIAFSNAWNWKVKVKSLSRVRLLATPWTAAHQAPPS